jgi:hypothetical protein
MSLSAGTPERRDFRFHWVYWSQSTTSWMAAAFAIALGMTVIVLTIFGVGEHGTGLALRVTARWSFVLFWLAYTGSAMAKLFGPRFAVLARRGREFGLAFAAAQFVHIGLVLWIIHIATEPKGAMLFFWVGILCTYLLALFSLPHLRNALGTRLWPLFHTVALEYIALVFAADFILIQLQEKGLDKYPLTYFPFALLLIGGAALRAAAYIQQLRRNF